jgi:hypothetical protein
MSKAIKPKGRKGRLSIPKPYGVHLVYAEGQKTEPLYIENMYKRILEKQKDQKSGIEIKVNPKAGGRSTLSLIDFAEKDMKKRRKNEEQIDHVWIFYDKDAFKTDDFDNAYHKIVNKNKRGFVNDDGDLTDHKGTSWHACWSNESFELWILLHFANIQSALMRFDYIEKINGYLISHGLKYEKNMNDLYDVTRLYGSVTNALAYAKALDQQPKKVNPSTGVYLFFEYFHQFLGL